MKIRTLWNSLPGMKQAKQRFPIAPQWIAPTFTACLTPTECLEASDSAENAPAMLHSWNDGMLPGIRWVRWGGRGDVGGDDSVYCRL